MLCRLSASVCVCVCVCVCTHQVPVAEPALDALPEPERVLELGAAPQRVRLPRRSRRRRRRHGRHHRVFSARSQHPTSHSRLIDSPP